MEANRIGRQVGGSHRAFGITRRAANRLYVWSHKYTLLAHGTALVLSAFMSKELIERRGGRVAKAAGLLFLAAMFYELNYLVCFQVRTKWIRWAWWFLMGIIGILLLPTIFGKWT